MEQQWQWRTNNVKTSLLSTVTTVHWVNCKVCLGTHFSSTTKSWAQASGQETRGSSLGIVKQARLAQKPISDHRDNSGNDRRWKERDKADANERDKLDWKMRVGRSTGGKAAHWADARTPVWHLHIHHITALAAGEGRCGGEKSKAKKCSRNLRLIDWDLCSLCIWACHTEWYNSKGWAFF